MSTNQVTAAGFDPAQLLADELAGKYPDARGRFGPFGGRYIPETLVAAFDRLEAAIRQHLHARDFQEELAAELRNWVGRPTALTQAKSLSKAWGADVWLKREDLAHTGAHKINNALGQALLAKRLGVKRIVAETGAGQHGVATAAACARVGLPCTVYMGAVDMERQAPNVGRMKLLGTTVVPVTSGDQTLRTPARTRSTTRSDRRCWRAGWGSAASSRRPAPDNTAWRPPPPAPFSASNASSTWAKSTLPGNRQTSFG